MNSDQRWILNAFLKSLSDIKPGEPHPHRIDLRLQLADMVIHEFSGDDIEQMIHRAHAEALREFYLTPDPHRHERYEAACQAYLDMLRLLKQPAGGESS
jgi:hypothetical protein